MAIRVTPDAQLSSLEAIKIRIAQLEETLKKTPDANDQRQINGRIRALKSRLASGAPDQTAADPKLLISKKDLE